MKIRVNGEEIPSQVVDFELNRLIQFYSEHGMPQERIREQIPMLKERAVSQAVGDKLLLKEAMRLDIPVSEDEVDERIARMKEDCGGEERFRKAMEKSATNIVHLRNQVRMGRKVDKLIEKITADIPEPTDEEAQAHYDAHRSEYRKSERVRAQHILVTPKSSSEEDRQEALAKIKGIRERVEAGADFASEAAAHSDCPSGRQAGGSLGWFSRGMMVKEFDDAVFSLPIGGLSNVVETQFGFHLIYKNDAEPEAIPEFYEIIDRIKDFLRHSARGDRLAAYVDELRSKAKVEIS